MIKDVTLTKSGLLKIEGQRRPVINISGLIDCLDRTAHIEEGATLESLVKVIYPYRGFVGDLTHCDMDSFLNDKSTGFGGDDDLDYLEIYWGAELDKFDDGPTFEFYTGFHGIGKPDEQFQITNYGIEFCNWKSLYKYPLKMNKKVSIYFTDYTFKKTEPMPPIPPEYFRVIGEGIKDFRLYDLIHGVFWELGFCGCAKKRDKQTKKLKTIAKDIDKRYRNTDTNIEKPI